jgi:alpha-N-arabinofuranosidase
MTNIAQMVNVLQAMIITDKDKMVLTPTYHAYKMYVPFQDATSLPVTLANNVAYSVGSVSIPGVSASAARGKDGKLWLALVNTNPGQPVDVAVDVGGRQVAAVNGQLLTTDAMDAHNTFQQAALVKPVPFSARAVGGKLSVKLPAKAVVVVAVEAQP